MTASPPTPQPLSDEELAHIRNVYVTADTKDFVDRALKEIIGGLLATIDSQAAALRGRAVTDAEILEIEKRHLFDRGRNAFGQAEIDRAYLLKALRSPQAQTLQADAEWPSMRMALEACKAKFNEYVGLHRDKGTPEALLKAETNLKMAALCEQALSVGPQAPGEQWREIASAPRDGTTIIAIWARDPASAASTICMCHFSEHHQKWWDVGALDEPTHWQPLPSPPGAKPAEPSTHRCIGCKREMAEAALKYHDVFKYSMCPHCNSTVVKMDVMPKPAGPEGPSTIARMIATDNRIIDRMVSRRDAEAGPEGMTLTREDLAELEDLSQIREPTISQHARRDHLTYKVTAWVRAASPTS